jgi:molybdenum cofactor synthesis domain-containing protein
MYKVAIVCLSDKGYEGIREDKSTKVIEEIVTKWKYEVIEKILLPDEIEMIEKKLIELCDSKKIDLIFTTGGTGFTSRDNTPEATKRVLTREVPGIAEAIRAYSITITKRAMLSRGVSGIRGETLIINLPGSPKAVSEIVEYIIDTVGHGLDLIKKGSQECGR